MSDAQNPQKKPFRAVRRPSGRGIADRVRGIIAPVAGDLGYTLWDVEYVKEGADYILRVTIDKEEGVTIDDCERMTRAIDPILDETDPIDGSYLLEVSSPGIERDLTRDEHFAACTGEKVEVRLFAPVDGNRVFTGLLGGLTEDNQVIVTVGENEMRFGRKDIAKIRTVFDF